MIEKILFYFFIYGFFGWCYESVLVSIKRKQWVNRGFLNGPIIPIYAFGSISLVASLNWLLPYIPKNIVIQSGTLFVFGMLISTALEYIVSYGMEILFNARWWDYSNKKLNVNGRICLTVSLIWGGATLILWYLMHPQVLKVYELIPTRFLVAILWVLGSIFILDLAGTLNSLIDFRNVVIEMYKMKNELLDGIDKIKNIQEELQEDLHQELRERIDLLEQRFIQRQRRLLLAFPNLKTKMIDDWMQEVKVKIHKNR